MEIRKATGLLRMAVVALCIGWLIQTADSAAENSVALPRPQTLSLEQCIDTAMAKNRSRPASRFAVAAAEAQSRQALAGYWPHISVQGAYELMDEPHNYIFPSSTFSVPSSSIDVPGMNFQTSSMNVTIPANSFGQGFPPQNVRIPVASQNVNVPGQSFAVPGQSLTIPDQEIKLQDEQSWYVTLEAQWLLWDGGMRKGLREQAQAGVDAARAALRRTDLEVVDSVTRLYHGAVLAKQVRKQGEDTLARMEATLRLTETMYKEGAGKVMKTDYLDNKVMVETLRAAVALLEKNEATAQAALAYTMGLAWNESVRPADREIPYVASHADMESLVSKAYAFSPDWESLEAGIRAARGSLREAQSGHYPQLAVTGDLHRWWNDYDKGYATDENKEGWTVSVGFELPLFKGFLTRNKVKEARARVGKMLEERILLREGIGLQVRQIVIGLAASEKRYQATLDAMNSATENRGLNTRAYQNDLVETEDVIRSQLMEAFMSVQHCKMRYDHAALRSRLGTVVGSAVERTLAGE
jgi:outer membrane protein